MILQITQRNECQDHDRFIIIKKQIYSDETIISIPLTKSNEPRLRAHKYH
jgi:hypothetical protein